MYNEDIMNPEIKVNSEDIPEDNKWSEDKKVEESGSKKTTTEKVVESKLGLDNKKSTQKTTLNSAKK